MKNEIKTIKIAVAALLLGAAFEAGLNVASPDADDLNESAASLCYELGGEWLTDWCDISFEYDQADADLATAQTGG